MEIKSKKDFDLAMVNYYNTLPFTFGLKENEHFNLIMDIPSKCMGYFLSGDADIALVPVATLLNQEGFKIITDYCIGCVGEVRTVAIFSKSKISDIKRIYLDKDSRTSQLLVKILCRKYWEIDPVFEQKNVRELDTSDLSEDTAILMIGDKVFDAEGRFEYAYDLGEEWQKMTGLPFTFAVWIARENVPEEVISDLNKSLSIGVNDIQGVVGKNQHLDLRFNLSEYFKKHIDYRFDDGKKESLKLYNDYAEEILEKAVSTEY